MNITKTYGRIAEEKSGSCRLEVLGFLSNGKLITDAYAIRQYFVPHGFVFAPNFFNRFDEYEIDTVVEFMVLENKQVQSDKDRVLMDMNKPCKRAGAWVVDVEQNIFSNERAIDQTALKQYIDAELGHFYIRHQQKLFGPFKVQNKEVLPKSGMTVSRYAMPEGMVLAADEPYLLHEPIDAEDTLDCMTQAQLTNFISLLVKNNKIAGDIGKLKKGLEGLTLDGLEKARLERAVKSIDHLQFGLDELKSFAELSSGFQKLYERALALAEDHLKEEKLDDVMQQKDALEKELKGTKQTLQKLKSDEQKLQASLRILKEDHAHLAVEKEKIIQDIRIKAEIQNVTPDVITPLRTYEETVWEKTLAPYENLREFIRNIISVSDSKDLNEQIDFGFLNLLKDYRCFLTENSNLILEVARLTNNCKVILQQVEPDWIRFEKFYLNGLEQIWQSAHANPDMLHFLVLEDVNLAGFECYGKPLSDLMLGRRQYLPGCGTAWPDNLWVFADFIKPTEHGFGLPLTRAAFEDWAYVPVGKKITWKKDAAATKQLKPYAVIRHNDIAPFISNPHLSE